MTRVVFTLILTLCVWRWFICRASTPCTGTAIAGELPADAVVRFIDSDNIDVQANGSQSILLVAGHRFRSVGVALDGNGSYFNVTLAKVKFVSEPESLVDAACSAGATAPVGTYVSQPFDGLGVTAEPAGCNELVAEAPDGFFQFLMGGRYRVCFSDDGTFEGALHAELFGAVVDVRGIYDDCNFTNCLAAKPYKCYAIENARSPPGSCALTINSSYLSAAGFASLSSLWLPTWNEATGELMSLNSSDCGTTHNGSVFNSSVYVQILDGVAELPRTNKLTQAQEGYTLAACYCPEVDGCDDDNAFVQQIGIIYIFVSRVCDENEAQESACKNSPAYQAVAPSHSFALLVYCPPGACSSSAESRVRLADASADGNSPAWDEAHGCHDAPESTLHVSPSNCQAAVAGVMNCTLEGGLRQDWKLFGSGPEGGFLLAPRGVDYEVRNFHYSKGVDICFCNSACSTPMSWFKVGLIRHTSYRLMDLGARQVSTVGVPGTLGLQQNKNSDGDVLDTLGLASGSMIKLLQESIGSFGDSACGTALFDESSVPALTHSTAMSSFKGQVDANGTAIIFDGGSSSNLLTFRHAGVYAICYCRFASCDERSDHWVLASRYAIRGPAQIHDWSFSTGVAVRLDYGGFGLRPSDTLRIIDSSGACTDNNGDPDAAPSIQVGCPAACTAVENALDGSRMNLATVVAGWDSVGCSTLGDACRQVFLKSVQVVSDSFTELLFDGDPGLSSGDRIVLSADVVCGSHCTTEQLASVRGVNVFANGGENEAGVRVVTTNDRNRVLLPLGWPHDARGTTRPEFLLPRGHGKWTRNDAASTAEELKGTAAREGLRVCWRPGNGNTYLQQVGGLRFVEPRTMSRAQISLTARGYGATAPLVISFVTGTSAGYTETSGPMELRLAFADVALLEPRLTDGTGILTASGSSVQASCGMIFHELWVASGDEGFPMPRECRYHRVGHSVELVVSFEARNGLRPSSEYQLVVTATAREPLATDTEMVQIRSMSDVIRRPYEVLELGQAVINTRLQLGPQTTSPRFAGNGGLSVVGGSSSVLELQEELEFQFRLTGDRVGKIVGESVLRLFMYPLTQWDMSYARVGSSSCEVECTPHQRTNCGFARECTTEALVSQNNIVRIRLPSDMTEIAGPTAHEFRVKSLTLPRGGFFPGRIGAEISTSDEGNPDFTESSGDFLWKQPDDGATVAALIITHGEGVNEKPFRGDTGNILRARLLLGATLRASATRGAQAFLTIEMPHGYSCSGVRALSAAGTFRGGGGGSLRANRWLCSGTVCSYSLLWGEIIPAGTAVLVDFLVDNPEKALSQAAASNRWTLKLSSTGDHAAAQSLKPTIFGFSNGSGANIGVLGKLSEAYVQPTNFAMSPASLPQVSQDLYVFFRTEQSVGTRGSRLLFMAPPSFDFGLACVCNDLAPSYYVGPQGNAVQPLPSISDCRGSSSSASSDNLNHASLVLSGALQGSRSYAFRILVVNPGSCDESAQSRWDLRTMTESQDHVDGTPKFMSFNPVSADDAGSGLHHGWRLYQNSMRLAGDIPPEQAALSVHPLLPYSLTGEEATFTLFPLRTLQQLDQATLRITAPDGYLWFFSERDFIYKSPAFSNASNASSTVAGTTADFPGGVPAVTGNLLTWAAANYSAIHTYGFSTRIRVADHSPTRSSNAFFIEFGYGDGSCSGATRNAAVRIHAPPVRALQGARVDYTTNVRGQKNIVRFAVKTVTPIAFRGGLVVDVPIGFAFPESCHPRSVAGAKFSPLPDDISCKFQYEGEGESQLRLLAGPSSLRPQYYAFELAGTNPSVTSELRRGEATSCGASQCWTFRSLEVADNAVSSTELDARVSAVGFAIQEAMPFAGFAPFGLKELAISGRDDRALRPNVLAFAFRLGRNFGEAGLLTLRGPLGIQFPEDCLMDGGVTTDLHGLIGDEELPRPPVVDEGDETSLAASADFLLSRSSAIQQKWWSSAWEPSLPILECSGDGSVARLLVGAGLEKGRVHAFAIKTRPNPASTPAYNKWTLEAAGESSAPFDGFPVWTFSQSYVTYLSAATRVAGVQLNDLTPNLVNLTFRPLHAVVPGGSLLVSAPPNFIFAEVAWPCPLLLEERNPLALSEDNVSGFSSDDLRCETSPDKEALTLRLISSRGLKAGCEYRLVVRVHNPPSTSSARVPRGGWRLESFESSGVALDAALLPELLISSVVTTWSYLIEATGLMTTGLALVKDLLLNIRFANNLDTNDKLTIFAPFGYDLESPDNESLAQTCNNLRWLPSSGRSPITEDSATTCKGNRLTVVFLEKVGVLRETLVQLLIDTMNPPRPPPVAQRFWVVEHRSAAGDLLSSGFFMGWRVVPQLVDAHIGLISRRIAAGSLSTLEISFVSVSRADSIRLEATEPDGFDFSQCQVLSPMHSRIDAISAVVRVRAIINPDMPTVIQIDKVLLASVGGQTRFSLMTYDTNGELLDRQLGFRGFRLPGSIDVTNVAFQSIYKQAPSVYPVRSRWSGTLATQGLASFSLEFSNVVRSGEVLKIVAPAYELMWQQFGLEDILAGQLVPAQLSYVAAGEMRVVLDADIFVGRLYRLVVSAVAPRTFSSAAMMWIFETSDGGDLPTAYANASLDGFRFVSNFGLKVTATRAPPIAEVEISIALELGTARPSILRLVAPLGFNFNANCIVPTGRNTGIVSCEPGPALAGHQTAHLLCLTGGVNGTIQDLRLRVTTPKSTPPVRSWLIDGVVELGGQQLGWGQDLVGFEVMQMSDTSVTYSGSSVTTGQLVVNFKTSETIDRGGRIELLHPKEYTFKCTGKDLHVISLPGVLECRRQAMSVLLILNGTLSKGAYAFALTVLTPDVTPPENYFSIVIQDSMGRVRDASMTRPGQTIYPRVTVAALPLLWTSSDAGQASTITVGFEVIHAIPRRTIGGICIVLPQHFAHSVERSGSIVDSNKDLPVFNKDKRVNFSMENELLLQLDPKKSIPEGNYSFQFPVVIPNRMPAFNVWQLLLCLYRNTTGGESCAQPSSPDVLMKIPMAGFPIGAPPNDLANVPVSRGSCTTEPRIALHMVPLCVVFWYQSWSYNVHARRFSGRARRAT
eukprot:TRINITY_DN48622_c0_g1_i1.p1 TRINITY_DN48622_c0_g1~~TRINITY_DN48622_c0_g1_i1.p1  ORF type:complete len:3075 (+),score=329.05 TRINITY_DN48622_c0_g1_i1:114-9338(+)